jgi:hypothetical protein
MHKPLLCSLALLVGCGGGGGSPTAPQLSAATPPPTAPMRIADTSSPSGSTVPLTIPSNLNGRVGLNWQVVVTWPTSHGTAQVHSQLLDAQGQECASNFSPSATLNAGVPTVYTHTAMLVNSTRCPFPFTTTKLRTTLWSVVPQGTPAEHSIGWTFTDGGGQFVQPTPPPGDGGGAATCSDSRPSASCGTASARCEDNTLSCSQTRQGTCSGHGGIRCVWCPGPLC